MKHDKGKPMKVSFDFDNTLDNPKMQRLAKRFMYQGAEVWVTTSRREMAYGAKLPHTDLYRTLKMLNLPRSRVKFTNGEPKVDFLEGFDLHFDDSYGEIADINRYHRTCQGVLFSQHTIKRKL